MSEEVFEIEMAMTPNLMVGNAVEIGGKPFILVGIVHTAGGFGGTTRARVARPGWRWRVKYRLRKLWRRILRPFQMLGRWLRRRK